MALATIVHILVIEGFQRDRASCIRFNHHILELTYSTWEYGAFERSASDRTVISNIEEDSPWCN